MKKRKTRAQSTEGETSVVESLRAAFLALEVSMTWADRSPKGMMMPAVMHCGIFEKKDEKEGEKVRMGMTYWSFDCVIYYVMEAGGSAGI